jgi:hypothetical protein
MRDPFWSIVAAQDIVWLGKVQALSASFGYDLESLDAE